MAYVAKNLAIIARTACATSLSWNFNIKLLYDDLIEENLENLEMTHETFELLDELMGNGELDSEEDEESENENERQNDPIQKYNFIYDKIGSSYTILKLFNCACSLN